MKLKTNTKKILCSFYLFILCIDGQGNNFYKIRKNLNNNRRHFIQELGTKCPNFDSVFIIKVSQSKTFILPVLTNR